MQPTFENPAYEQELGEDELYEQDLDGGSLSACVGRRGVRRIIDDSDAEDQDTVNQPGPEPEPELTTVNICRCGNQTQNQTGVCFACHDAPVDDSDAEDQDTVNQPEPEPEVRYQVGVSSPYDQDDEISPVFDTYEAAKDFFDRMVNEHPSAIRIDIESVDEDGDCLELLDTHGVYYTDAINWETIATNAWDRR